MSSLEEVPFSNKMNQNLINNIKLSQNMLFYL